MIAIDLTMKVALVTGGSRGIGASITETFCRAGAYTFFTHTGVTERKKQVSDLISKIEKEGGAVREIVLDACDSSGTNACINEIVREKGRLDILVVNAGGYKRLPLEEVNDEVWQRTLNVNLSAPFFAIRAAVPHMVKQHYGRIILIGSSSAVDGGGGAIDYAAAKAGQQGLMLYLTRNYSKNGINTNLIHPCVIDTDLLRQGYSTPEDLKKLISQIPVGRLGKPEDIAGMAAYLASPLGDYICGQSFLLDGGRTLSR